MQRVAARIINVTPYRVIYGDTDQMGVVYYANYLRWFEKGRSEFLRQHQQHGRQLDEFAGVHTRRLRRFFH